MKNPLHNSVVAMRNRLLQYCHTQACKERVREGENQIQHIIYGVSFTVLLHLAVGHCCNRYPIQTTLQYIMKHYCAKPLIGPLASYPAYSAV